MGIASFRFLNKIKNGKEVITMANYYKRELRNGKWVYYYKTDSESNDWREHSGTVTKGMKTAAERAEKKRVAKAKAEAKAKAKAAKKAAKEKAKAAKAKASKSKATKAKAKSTKTKKKKK